MKPNLILASSLIALMLCGFLASVANPSSPNGYYIGYRLSFSTTITNKGSSLVYVAKNKLTDPTIFLFPNDTVQTVRLVSSSHSINADVDQDGNRIGVLNIEEPLGLGQSITIEVQFRVDLHLTLERRLEWKPSLEYSSSEHKQQIPRELVERYCVSAGPWRINDSSPSWLSVRRLASELAGNETNVLAALMRLTEWVGQNIKYPTTRRDDIQSPDETLSSREGDCDEQANLIISFCRILGIPAYLQCGCVYLPSRVDRGSKFNGRLSFDLDRLGWHAWAMIYVPPWGWLPVDMTMGYSKEYPLLAVEGAAVETMSTVVSNNLLVTDYISETNLAAEQLGRTDVYVEEKESMKPTGISPEYQATPSMQATTIALMGFAVVVVAAYLAARFATKSRLKRNQQ